MILSLLNEDEDKKREETVISGVAAAAYTGRSRSFDLAYCLLIILGSGAGGSDTVSAIEWRDPREAEAFSKTVSALGSFFLAMLLYPEIQRKAQAEVDRVIGSGRLPDFSDEPALPYVTALVKEILR